MMVMSGSILKRASSRIWANPSSILSRSHHATRTSCLPTPVSISVLSLPLAPGRRPSWTLGGSRSRTLGHSFVASTRFGSPFAQANGPG